MGSTRDPKCVKSILSPRIGPELRTQIYGSYSYRGTAISFNSICWDKLKAALARLSGNPLALRCRHIYRSWNVDSGLQLALIVSWKLLLESCLEILGVWADWTLEVLLRSQRVRLDLHFNYSIQVGTVLEIETSCGPPLFLYMRFCWTGLSVKFKRFRPSEFLKKRNPVEIKVLLGRVWTVP